MRASWVPFLVLAGGLVAGCKSEQSSAPKPAELPPAPAMPAAEPPKAAPVAEAEPEDVPALPTEAQTVAGSIILPKARKKDVKKGDTMFLIVRRGGGSGPGMMLAVQKLMVEDFPMPFVLSERDAMVPGTKFSGEVNLSVRVDKDGDPMTRRKGDVFGELLGVKVGTQDVTLPLDTLQKEDQVLGAPAPGGGAPHGGMPPGHP